MRGQIRPWSPRYSGKTLGETLQNMEVAALEEESGTMRYPCRAIQGENCCYASTGCSHSSLEDWEKVKDNLSTRVSIGEVIAALRTLSGLKEEDLKHWEVTESTGVVMTAPDRFVQGLMVGVFSMLVTGVIILWYLSGGM